ncbi:hypothetical protein PVAP13_4NG229566 [Panicum virgatum]|uniref:Uncharacterized protein n=1 Tax=Panicum virgatum TaxID=38727 RepID=A0A8T0T3L5_PANVG|nr:hypothetical protein PVAP13_4NG229566 [Panicum virgatum]
MASTGDGSGAARRDLICVTATASSARGLSASASTEATVLHHDEDFYEALDSPDLLNPASGRSAINGARGKLW